MALSMRLENDLTSTAIGAFGSCNLRKRGSRGVISSHGESSWAAGSQWNGVVAVATLALETLSAWTGLGVNHASVSCEGLEYPLLLEHVPVGVASNLPQTQMVAVMVEKNPSMMAGLFEFTDNAVPDVSMRVKMGQSSDVYALVKADGKFYMAKKEIKVTLGGCGG